MANGYIVNCDPGSKHLMTVEREVSTHNGSRISGELCGLDGNPIGNSGKAPVEVYLDVISGNHFARISPEQQSVLVEAEEIVYQGVGGVVGWFVPAPDHTINGRHGWKEEPEAESDKEAKDKAKKAVN